MILHRIADDVGDLVVAHPPIPSLNENSSLNGQPSSARNSSFENYEGSIIEKPIAIHVVDVNRIVPIGPFIAIP